MPEQGTKRQKKIFEKLKKYLTNKGYEYRDYNGSKADYYRFGRPICCYMKYVSLKPRVYHKESIQVLVMKNDRNKDIKGGVVYPRDRCWGKRGKEGSISVFAIPGNQESRDIAKQLIDTIKM